MHRSQLSREARQEQVDANRVAQQRTRSSSTPNTRQAYLQQDRSSSTSDTRQAHLQQDAATHQMNRVSGKAEFIREKSSIFLYLPCLLNVESPAVRQVRLQCRRERRAVNPDVPLLEQASVHTKMIKFHSKLSSLEFHTCTSCLEHFPNLAMAACSFECSCSGCGVIFTLTP